MNKGGQREEPKEQWGRREGRREREEKSVIEQEVRITSIKITDQISKITKTDKDKIGSLHHVLC